MLRLRPLGHLAFDDGWASYCYHDSQRKTLQGSLSRGPFDHRLLGSIRCWFLLMTYLDVEDWSWLFMTSHSPIRSQHHWYLLAHHIQGTLRDSQDEQENPRRVSSSTEVEVHQNEALTTVIRSRCRW